MIAAIIITLVAAYVACVHVINNRLRDSQSHYLEFGPLPARNQQFHEPVGTPATVTSGGRGNVPAAFCDDVSLSFHN